MPAGRATRGVYGKMGERVTLWRGDNEAKARNGCVLQIQLIQGLQPLNCSGKIISTSFSHHIAVAPTSRG